ncbi:hypothetical protein C8R47DRAFT_1214857 [Mycena vitilis]|nr:hypothetical protein C8R47DRAFT_1214857 [Mycena vitilis]
MARYRLKLRESPEEEREEAVLRARAARARYRERNHGALLDAARSKRHAAYAEKYGAEALQAKLERKHQRQLEKQERPRRREHVKSARPTKTSGGRNTERRDDVPDGHHTAIIHPYQYVYPVTD